jgi:hypothetical protein
MAREDGLVASECTLVRAHTECNTECGRAVTVRQDCWATICAFMGGCRCFFNFDWVLEELLILLSLQEIDLERREEK